MKSKPPKLESSKIEINPSQSSFSITRIAVAQICQSVGFKAAQNSALETLTEIAARYLQAVAKSAAVSANFSGRRESNVFDIIKSLEDLCSVQGFHGASDVNLSLFHSSTLKNTIKFVRNMKETPFPKPIPRNRWFPSSKQQPNCLYRLKNLDNLNDVKRSIFGNGVLRHVPKWLPPMPQMGIEKGKWREKKWGFGFDREGEEEEERCLVGGEKRGEREGKKSLDLPLKRGKVKFKIGVGSGRGMGMGMERIGVDVDLRNGIICRGGKRVLCYNCDSDEEGKKKIIRLKRPR